MNYPEAKRKARALLGQHGDVQELKHTPYFPFRIGVWTEVSKGNKQFIVVGAGQDWESALNEAQKSQKPKAPHPLEAAKALGEDFETED